MANYLKILPIILVINIASCTQVPENRPFVNTNSSNESYENKDRKYKQLYDSIYINLALNKALNKEALALFIKDIEIMTDINLFNKVSKIAFEIGDYGAADIIASKWIKISPNSYLPYKFGLSASLENNNFARANNYFLSYLQTINPQSKSDYSRLMFSLSENRNRLNVIKFFEDYLQMNENRLLSLSYIELLYSYNKQTKVIEYINKIGTYNERNLVRLESSSLAALNQLTLAKDILIKYLQSKDISDRQVQIELLEIYLKLDDMLSATKLIDKILISDPDDISIILQISRLLYNREKLDLSEKYLSTLVIDTDEINYLRGMLDYRAGNYRESIVHFDRITSHTYKIQAQINKSSSILKIHGLVEAIEYLENLKTKYTSEDIKLQFWLAQVSHYNDKKLYRNIIEIVNKSLVSYKDNINLVYARAMAYEALKKVDLMEKDLLFILSIDNKNSNTLNALGYSLAIHTDRFDEAYNYITQALDYDPGSPAILDSMGWVLFKKGNYVDALKYAEIAYKKDQDPEIIEHYCQILIKNGLYSESRKIMEVEFKKNPNNSDLIDKLTSLHNNVPL